MLPARCTRVRSRRWSEPAFLTDLRREAARVAWLQGARRFRDEGIVAAMSKSEITVQRRRQATRRCRSRRAVRNAGLGNVNCPQAMNEAAAENQALIEIAPSAGWRALDLREIVQ